LNSIYYQDRFLEKLLDQYRELGLYERTLFVIVGDHGEAFGEHGFKLHDGVIYEEGIRVPLLLHGAGLAARRVPHVVSQVDILPTLVALLGYRIDAGTYDGGNLLEKDEGSVAHASCWYSERCIARIARDRKIVSHFGHREAEAYAIDADPRERRDVFGTRSDDPRSLDALHAWKREQLGRSTAFYQRRPGIPGP